MSGEYTDPTRPETCSVCGARIKFDLVNVSSAIHDMGGVRYAPGPWYCPNGHNPLPAEDTP